MHHTYCVRAVDADGEAVDADGVMIVQTTNALESVVLSDRFTGSSIGWFARHPVVAALALYKL